MHSSDLREGASAGLGDYRRCREGGARMAPGSWRVVGTLTETETNRWHLGKGSERPWEALAEISIRQLDQYGPSSAGNSWARNLDSGYISANAVDEDSDVGETPRDLSENEERRKSSTKLRRHQHLRCK